MQIHTPDGNAHADYAERGTSTTKHFKGMTNFLSL